MVQINTFFVEWWSGQNTDTYDNEMVQGPSMYSPAATATGETSTVVLDRLNVISSGMSGSVVHMIDAKVCFQGNHLSAIFGPLVAKPRIRRPKFGL
jgi:hypothetical protein